MRNWKTWFKFAGIRALKTFAQTIMGGRRHIRSTGQRSGRRKQRQQHSELFKSREMCNCARSYELSLFIKCEGCGENLSAKPYYFENGTKDVRWRCHWHIHVAPNTPKPMVMRDGTLKKIICEVLGIPEFSEDAMTEKRAGALTN